MPEFSSSLSVTGDCPECGCDDDCRVCTGYTNPPSFDVTLSLTECGYRSWSDGSCSCSNSCSKELTIGSGPFFGIIISLVPCWGYFNGLTINCSRSGSTCTYIGNASCGPVERIITYEGEDYKTIIETVTVQITITAISPTDFHLVIFTRYEMSHQRDILTPTYYAGDCQTGIIDLEAANTCDGSGFVSSSNTFSIDPNSGCPDFGGEYYGGLVEGTVTVTPGI